MRLPAMVGFHHKGASKVLAQACCTMDDVYYHIHNPKDAKRHARTE